MSESVFRTTERSGISGSNCAEVSRVPLFLVNALIEQCVVGVRCSDDLESVIGAKKRLQENFVLRVGRWIDPQALAEGPQRKCPDPVV